MKRTAVPIGFAFVVGIGMGMFASQVLHAQQEPVKSTVLLTKDLSGIEGKEAAVAVIDLAPGAVTGKHFHSAHEFVYVLEGVLTLTVEGQVAVTYKAGEMFHQPPKQIHTGKNGSTTTPAKVLQFLILDKGHPPAVPLK
jgi:quercetin dioxygenase-like cupin family protein